MGNAMALCFFSSQETPWPGGQCTQTKSMLRHAAKNTLVYASAAPSLPSTASRATPHGLGSLATFASKSPLTRPSIYHCALVWVAWRSGRRPGDCRASRRRCRLNAVPANASLETESLDDELLNVGHVSDLPKEEALGIELRCKSGLAAPVCVRTGDFLQEPFRLGHELTDDIQQNAETIAGTMTSLIKHFKWSKVVGCTVTTEVMDHMSNEQDDFVGLMREVRRILKQNVQGRVQYFYCAIHSVAAGYNELVWGGTSSKELWSHRNVLVCTLDRNIGAVLYNDGKRVRHSPLNALFTSHGQASLQRGCDKFSPPVPGSEAFDAWVEQLDSSLAKILGRVCADRIVLVPTGGNARCSEKLAAALMEPISLPLVQKRVAETGAELVVSQSEDEGSTVRGAALSALVEEQGELALFALEGVIHHKGGLDSLSRTQLLSIFNRLDYDCDGWLEPGALSLLGIQRNLQSLTEEMEMSRDGVASFEDFMTWWKKQVVGSRCVVMTSADAWQQLLDKEPSSGLGKLVVLKVTFTFCRKCRAFAPKWHKLSEKFRTVRFVELVGNGSCGAMELCTKNLGVKVTPAFFVFRRLSGELLCEWTGTSTERFEEILSKCLEEEERRVLTTA